MPKFKPSNHNPKNLKRAAIFQGKLLECGLTQRDIAEELQVTDYAVTKYAYGYSGARSKIETWAKQKFGEFFVEELHRILV